MGLCMSRESTAADPGKQAAGQAADAKAAAPSAGCPCAAGGKPAAGAACPVTGAKPAAAADPEPEPEHHKYVGSHTPARSALRSSADGSATPGSGLGRRSIESEGSGSASAGARGVRFAPSASLNDPRVTGDRRRSCEMASSDSISLKKIVDLFYDKVFADPRLSPFFKSVDVPKLKSHQVKFMEMAFGGKDLVQVEHPDLNLRRIHWRLIRDRGLSEEHWQWFFDHFKQTLAELPEIPESTRQSAVANVATTRVFFRPLTPEEEAGGGAAAAAAGGGAAAANGGAVKVEA